MAPRSIAQLRNSFQKFPRLTSVIDSFQGQVGVCLVLGGSNREHVGELLSIIASKAKSIDVVLTKAKARDFGAVLGVGSRVLVCGGAGDISMESLHSVDLRPKYDSVFFVVNNRYGIGYGNFLEIKDSLFCDSKSFFFNIAREFLYDDPANRGLIHSFESTLDEDDFASLTGKRSEDILNVLVDASAVTLTGRTGIENYTLRMLETLCQVKGIAVFALCQDKTILQGISVTCVFSDSSITLAEADARLSRVIKVFDIDLFVSPYRAIPNGLRCRTILVIHDLIPLLFPDFFETKATYRYFDSQIRSSCEHVDLVVTVSQSTSRDVIQLFKIPTERVRTVYPGCGAALSLSPVRPFGLTPLGTDAFILYNGTIEPRKGVAQLLSAYQTLRREFERIGQSPPYLVLSGKFGWSCSAEKQLIHEMSASGVLYLGYVRDEELTYLYQAASVLVYPSRYEGFGLPVLEAFSFGLPVITFDNSSLSEVGGGVAHFARPQDARGLFQALWFLLQSPRELENLRRKGLERARQFSWERYRKELCSLLKETFPNKAIG